MNLKQYAEVKKLPLDFLAKLGITGEDSVLVVPYFDMDGRIYRVRYRRGDKRWWSEGNSLIPYGLDRLSSYEEDSVFLDEGESDTQTHWFHGFAALGIPGNTTFQFQWADYLKKFKRVYLCPDNDAGGEVFTKKVVEGLQEGGYSGRIYLVRLPGNVKDCNDLHRLDPDKFRSRFLDLVQQAELLDFKTGNGTDIRREQLACQGDRFRPLASKDLIQILGLTIKKDENNKVVTFLCQLSAYTEDSQLNESFNAPSASGKTYIPLELAALFPPEDVIVVGYCSPTAFFHDVGVFDKERQGYLVDLSRRVLIFLDQPHTLLLQHLRPFLSHDKKEIRLKITDKSQKAGLRTKNIYLKGYPAVIFCTAGLKIDEQEATRFLLLSPEISQEKIREAIYLKIKKEADPKAYSDWLESDPERKFLRERILAIREAQIKDIKISCPEKVEQCFFSRNRVLKPRHSRDITRILSLIKCFALLNWWHRDRDGSTVVANGEDLEEAFKIWDEIAESQELNLPPYIYNFYKDVILAAWEEEKGGLTRGEIRQKHYEVCDRMLPDWQLKREILPMLETAGLISLEQDPSDRRKTLVYPTLQSSISREQNNRKLHGGVTLEPLQEDDQDEGIRGIDGIGTQCENESHLWEGKI